MNYKEFRMKNANSIVEIVKEIIEEDGLKTSKQIHYIAHQRWFLFWYLRENTLLTWQSIGDLFNKKHDVVMYGVKKHHERIEMNDRLYIDNFKVSKDYIEYKLNNVES